jgi:hypothetical protein
MICKLEVYCIKGFNSRAAYLLNFIRRNVDFIYLHNDIPLLIMSEFYNSEHCLLTLVRNRRTF